MDLRHTRNRGLSPFSGVRPVAITHHPLVTTYNDGIPPPSQVDQFSPQYTRRITVKKDFGKRAASAHAKLGSFVKIEDQNSANNRARHEEMEDLFDEIATGACDNPLNVLVEQNLRAFLKADNVSYFHDVPSVSALYCPTSAVICPHGCGLIGYCHFSRKTLRIDCAKEHMSYAKAYDGKVCQVNSRVLVFPIFDCQGHVKSVVQAIRSASGSPFREEDEEVVTYLQRKFQLYSRWLFQPVISESTIASLVQAQRLGEFVDTITTKMTRLFNCKGAELWELKKEDNEALQFVPGASLPLPWRISESGIVGYALSTLSAISITAVNRHAAYNQRIDGSGDQSIFVLPVKDQESLRVYGLVLRGKRLPGFFTDVDEKVLSRLAPVIIASLNSSEVVERSYQGLEEAMMSQQRLQSLLEVAETLSGQLQIDDLIPSIMNRACELVKADRCSVFMVSENREKLVTFFHGGLANAIEIPIGAGIVGFTATTGQILNIKDAYEDPRFNRATDLATGYRTQNLLCVPIFDDKNEIRGVTEMINKVDGVFTTEDERLIQVFNVFCGISIENARLYRASIDLSLQLRTIIQISQSIVQTSQIKKLIEDILRNSRRVIGAGRAMVYLVNDQRNLEIFATDEDIDAKALRVKKANEMSPNGKFGARRALIHKMMEECSGKSTEQMQRHDSERMQLVQTTIQTGDSQISNNEEEPDEGMIVCPVVNGSDRSIMGALLMQWKKKEHVFTQEDLRLLESFSIFVSISIERSKLKAAEQIGALELTLRETLPDEMDRKSTITPEKLLLHEDEKAKVLDLGPETPDIDDFRLFLFFFDLLDLRKNFEIHNEVLFGLFFTVRENYKEVPFFNWKHVRNSLHFLCYVVQKIGVDMFDPQHRLAMFIAVLTRDMGNTGYAKDFHANVEPYLKYLNNSQDALVSHRCCALIDIISQPKCNIFAQIDANTRNELWKVIVDLIVASGMKNHFSIVDNKSDPLWSPKMIVKMAILSDLIRSREFASDCRKSACEEFCVYGDVSQVADLVRDNNGNVDPEKSESAFLKGVCLPIFRNFSGSHLCLKPILAQIEAVCDC